MRANREYLTEQNESTKMKYLSDYKYELKREKYIEQLPREKAREVFKLRSKMMNLRMNYKNMYTNTKSQDVIRKRIMNYTSLKNVVR